MNWTPAPVPAVPRDVSIGLPAELARRRPDIREAEANLHAATAADRRRGGGSLSPPDALRNGGFQSETAGNLLGWASRFGSFGPALDLPVFDRGRWKTVRLYDVRAREAALAYQRTVLNALHEVENCARRLSRRPGAAHLAGCDGRTESRRIGAVAPAL